MEAAEQISKFQEFLEMNYHAKLLDASRIGQKFLEIDFQELSKFSPELADELIEHPEETIKAFELAIGNFDLPNETKDIKIRIYNLTMEQRILIRNIRSNHLGKFVWFEGIVRQKSDVRPQVTTARFECPSCGNIITVLQLDTKFKEPSRCGCGRKGKFRLLSKELVDAQGLVLEEATKDLEGGEQPKRFNVLLKNDLVSPISEKKTNPGSTIKLSGIVKEIPIILRSGGQSIKFDLIIEANHIEALEEDYTNIQISPEDEIKIKELALDPKSMEKLIHALAPGVFGHERIKEALLMQFVGGVQKLRDDGIKTRGDIHVLLIGDPGSGKTISGESMITLSDGRYIQISEIVNKYFKGNEEYYPIKDHNLYAPCLNKYGKIEHKKITGLWKRKSEQLYKIITRTGKEIIGTETNPLFILKNSKINTSKTKDIKTGDYIATPRIINEFQLKEQTLYFVNKKIDLFFLSKFLAYVLSKSCSIYNEDNNKKKNDDDNGNEQIIEFINKDESLVNKFCEVTYKLFNYKCSIVKKKNCISAIINSKKIILFLNSLEPSIMDNSPYKKIPKTIFLSENEIIKDFLYVFFECENYINNNEEIKITLENKNITEQIQHLLLRFGILSQKQFCKEWNIFIDKKNTRKLIDEIGVISITNFNNNDNNDDGNIVNDIKIIEDIDLDIIPNIGRILKYTRQKLQMTQSQMNIPKATYLHYELENINLSRNSLEKIVERLKIKVCELLIILNKKEINYSDSNSQILVFNDSSQQCFLNNSFVNNIFNDELLLRYLNDLSLLANSSVLWDEIIYKEKYFSNEHYIYDLEIEDEYNFIANDIFVHNSQLLKRASVVAPKARYVSGKGVSGAGLTAAVVKDEFLSGWSLEAGALVLANKGILMIDEMDKMSDDDRSAMHEGLEQQTISISKANIQATLRCETTVLAAANPKFGRFDPYENISKQIDMPPALINRFDLIFVIKDVPNEERDERMAKFILTMHKERLTEEPAIPTDVLRKYLIYARQKIFPVLTDSAFDELKEYYVKIRSSGSNDESSVKSVPISARQLEALVRLSEASAKLRLSDKITKKDAKRAIEILMYCLEQVGMDPETGKIDIDRITTGITSSERGKIMGVKEIINELEVKFGKMIPIEEIIKAAAEKNIDSEKVEQTIEKLKRTGDLFEPKPGKVQKI